MVALRPPGKSYEIANKILKKEGVKIPKPGAMEKTVIKGSYLQH